MISHNNESEYYPEDSRGKANLTKHIFGFALLTEKS